MGKRERVTINAKNNWVWLIKVRSWVCWIVKIPVSQPLTLVVIYCIIWCTIGTWSSVELELLTAKRYNHKQLPVDCHSYQYIRHKGLNVIWSSGCTKSWLNTSNNSSSETLEWCMVLKGVYDVVTVNCKSERASERAIDTERYYMGEWYIRELTNVSIISN